MNSMRKNIEENNPATVRDVREIVNEIFDSKVNSAIAEAVRQIVEFVGNVHDKLDSKIDGVDSKQSNRIDGLSQELYETKVELRNEIRGLRNDHDARLTRLETGKLIT